VWRRDGISHPPRELQLPRPVPDRAVPARRVCLALVDVFDQPVREPVAVGVTPQRPLVLGLGGAQRVGVREQAPELRDEQRPVAQAGDERGIATSLFCLGNVAFRQNDMVRARALYEESLAIFRELGDRSGMAGSFNNLGNVARHQGDYVSAHSLYEEGLAFRRELGDKRGIANALIGLALAYVVMSLMGLLLGLVAFWTLETTGMLAIFRFTNLFFAGGLVPLAFFPAPLRAIADLLPFQTQAFIPVSLYLGRLAGVDAALKAAPIDANRLGLWGWSYGGYMTFMATTKKPDSWKAAVASVGITDLHRLYEKNNDQFKYYLRQQMGDPERNADLWRERSAIHFADRLRAKLLMIHGSNDPRCPVEQSQLFRDKLLELGRTEGADFEYVEFTDQGHGSADIAHKIRTYQLMADYFQRNL